MRSIDCKADAGWLSYVLNALCCEGFCIVTSVLEERVLGEVRAAMYRTSEAIKLEVGEQRLRAAGELGVLRLMLKFDPVFFKLLDVPEILQLVDSTVSPTAILHLQNGFILPSYSMPDTPKVFQNRLHRDFPRVLNGYIASINTLLAIDGFTEENGGTLLVPGSHQKSEALDMEYLAANAVVAACPAGAILVFDSTIWHAAGPNLSGKDRLGINQQFTRSYIKQQVDYVRALGEPAIRQQAERTQQLLGYYTRVVTSLDEYYRPEQERLYRGGQG